MKESQIGLEKNNFYLLDLFFPKRLYDYTPLICLTHAANEDFQFFFSLYRIIRVRKILLNSFRCVN